MNKTLILIIMMLTSAVSIMSTDLYAPSLPHLAELLDTTPDWVKLTLGLNAMAYGIAQLFFGPMSDRFGRRPLMLFGVISFSLFSLLCALVDDIYQLIGMRVLQGISAGAGAVLVLAVITDIFPSKERIKALALYGSVLALAPALAPTIGGYIHVNLGWRYNFYLLALVATIISIMALRYLPETNKELKKSMPVAGVLNGYLGLLKDPAFVGYSLLTSCALASVFAFVAAGPFILINQFSVATEHYGYYQLITVLFFILGSWVSAMIAEKVSTRRLLSCGLLLFTSGAMALVLIIYNQALSPTSLIVAVGIMNIGLGPIFAVAPSLAMNTKSAPSGVAAAMLGCLEMVGPTLAAISIGVFHDGSAMPYGITVLVIALTALVLYCLVLRSHDGQRLLQKDNSSANSLAH
ncbi:hypothetical protein A9Q81_15370 [Gammaproteobacteria bacterium 42_54_T18]|nr:hypothetical protein A9Q81_15370 [Gammaproteobacteria bacterium 42_54_T18]